MIITLEQRPPRAIAVEFTGDNAAEVAEFLGWDEVPTVETGTPEDGERAQGQPVLRLDLYGWGSQYATALIPGDHLVRHDSGALSPMRPEALAQQFRVVEE